eukprot:1160429-Pelagomonas_calceolata.AAC.13
MGKQAFSCMCRCTGKCMDKDKYLGKGMGKARVLSETARRGRAELYPYDAACHVTPLNHTHSHLKVRATWHGQDSAKAGLQTTKNNKNFLGVGSTHQRVGLPGSRDYGFWDKREDLGEAKRQGQSCPTHSCSIVGGHYHGKCGRSKDGPYQHLEHVRPAGGQQ